MHTLKIVLDLFRFGRQREALTGWCMEILVFLKGQLDAAHMSVLVDYRSDLYFYRFYFEITHIACRTKNVSHT